MGKRGKVFGVGAGPALGQGRRGNCPGPPLPKAHDNIILLYEDPGISDGFYYRTGDLHLQQQS